MMLNKPSRTLLQFECLSPSKSMWKFNCHSNTRNRRGFGEVINPQRLHLIDESHVIITFLSLSLSLPPPAMRWNSKKALTMHSYLHLNFPSTWTVSHELLVTINNFIRGIVYCVLAAQRVRKQTSFLCLLSFYLLPESLPCPNLHPLNTRSNGISSRKQSPNTPLPGPFSLLEQKKRVYFGWEYDTWSKQHSFTL